MTASLVSSNSEAETDYRMLPIATGLISAKEDKSYKEFITEETAERPVMCNNFYLTKASAIF